MCETNHNLTRSSDSVRGVSVWLSTFLDPDVEQDVSLCIHNSLHRGVCYLQEKMGNMEVRIQACKAAKLQNEICFSSLIRFVYQKKGSPPCLTDIEIMILERLRNLYGRIKHYNLS